MTSKHQRVPEITRLVDLYSRNCQKKVATGLKQSVKGVNQGATGLLQGDNCWYLVVMDQQRAEMLDT